MTVPMIALTVPVAIFAAVTCLTAFLVGGIPFGFLIGRKILRDDIRHHGSGNIGATNVGRVLGWKWGGVVLLLDALKGLLPTLTAWLLAERQLPDNLVLHLTIATGMSAIIGHMYPVYLKLRGGKGVATALGVIIIIAPIASAGALLVFAAAMATTRIVAVASMLAAAAFALAQLLLLRGDAFSARYWSLTLFSVAVPAMIIWRHRSNIQRLLHGKEGRWRPAAAGESYKLLAHRGREPTVERPVQESDESE